MIDDFRALCRVMGLDFANESHAGRILRVFMNVLYARYYGGSKETRTKIKASFKKEGLRRLLDDPSEFPLATIWEDVLPDSIREKFGNKQDIRGLLRAIVRKLHLPKRGFGGRAGGLASVATHGEQMRNGGLASVATHGAQMRNGRLVGGLASVATHGAQMRNGGVASVATHGAQMRNGGLAGGAASVATHGEQMRSRI
jgi:hypothetical protein